MRTQVEHELIKNFLNENEKINVDDNTPLKNNKLRNLILKRVFISLVIIIPCLCTAFTKNILSLPNATFNSSSFNVSNQTFHKINDLYNNNNSNFSSHFTAY